MEKPLEKCSVYELIIVYSNNVQTMNNWEPSDGSNSEYFKYWQENSHVLIEAKRRDKSGK